MQHGGPPAALLAHVLSAHEPVPGTRAGRIAVDVLGPIPVGPVTVTAVTVRPGRRIQLVAAEMTAGGRAVARAAMWRLAELAVPPPLMAGTPGPESAPDLPDRREWRLTFPGAYAEGYLAATEGRPVHASPGEATVWLRQKIPLVAGTEPSPLERILVVGDSGSGISAALDPTRYLFLNVDLVVTVHRDAEGEWVCLRSRTVIGDTGTGLVDTTLFDRSGAVGHATQTLLVTPRT